MEHEKHSQIIPIISPVDGIVKGPASVYGKSDVGNSPYYLPLDFYNDEVSKTLIKLPRFKTYQQTSEHSCGAACVLMVLDFMGMHGVGENELDREMDGRFFDNPREDGTVGVSTDAVANAFKSRGFEVESSRDLQDESGKYFKSELQFANYIRQNILEQNAILVESVEQGGHWKVLIGYDDMGTETLSDDVLVFADPYDIFDHHQNGYTIASFQRFLYGWVDACVIYPKICYQQFVTVKRKQCD